MVLLKFGGTCESFDRRIDSPCMTFHGAGVSNEKLFVHRYIEHIR